MAYMIVIFSWRKPGLNPIGFKNHYESSHVPLLKSIAGNLFPTSHTRYYIQRTSTGSSSDTSNAAHPASVLAGGQDAFGYDAYAELVFEDETAFQKFFGHMTSAENAKKIAEDEEHFLDRAKMTIAVIGDRVATTA